MATVLQKGLFYLGNTVLQKQPHFAWENALAAGPLMDRVRLLTQESKDRVDYLAASLGSDSTTDWSDDGERAWLLQWQDDLQKAKTRMKSTNPMAQRYFASRYAAMEKQLQAANLQEPEKPHASPSEAGTAPAEGQSVAADKKQQLWELYRDLEKQRTELDRNDPEAVRRFNEAAAAYQKLQSAKQ